MKIIIVLFTFFMLFASMARIKDTISRVVVFCFLGYWSVSLFVSTFSPYGYYSISNYTYFILLLGVSAFILGMMISYIPSKASVDLKYIDKSLSKLFTSTPMLLFYVVLLLYSLQFVEAALITSAMNEGVENADRFENVFKGNGIAALIYNNVMFPLFHMGLCFVMYSLVTQKKQIVPIVIIILFSIAFAILQGGRSIFMIILLYLIIVYVSVSSQKAIMSMSLKKVITSTLVVSVVIIGIMYMTSYRTTGSFMIEKTDREEYFEDATSRIVEYSVLPLVLFETSLNEDYFNQFNGPTFGRATFTGIDVVMRGVFKRFGIKWESTQDIVDYVQETWKPVSQDAYYNYAYTGLFYHYMDFGLLGVILFPFVFGVIFRRIIKEFYKLPTPPMLFLLGVCFFMTMHSIFTCYFIKPWIMMYIVFLLLWHVMIKRKYSLRIGI